MRSDLRELGKGYFYLRKVWSVWGRRAEKALFTATTLFNPILYLVRFTGGLKRTHTLVDRSRSRSRLMLVLWTVVERFKHEPLTREYGQPFPTIWTKNISSLL